MEGMRHALGKGLAGPDPLVYMTVSSLQQVANTTVPNPLGRHSKKRPTGSRALKGVAKNAVNQSQAAICFFHARMHLFRPELVDRPHDELSKSSTAVVLPCGRP